MAARCVGIQNVMHGNRAFAVQGLGLITITLSVPGSVKRVQQRDEQLPSAFSLATTLAELFNYLKCLAHQRLIWRPY